jgi:hypothetical protein
MDKANENGDDSITATRRKLDNYHIHCSFEGKYVAPGQWLQGPDKTCMCDRHGSQAFVACVANGAMAAAAPQPGESLTALGTRQEFQANDFVFDLLGSVSGAITIHPSLDGCQLCHRWQALEFHIPWSI